MVDVEEWEEDEYKEEQRQIYRKCCKCTSMHCVVCALTIRKFLSPGALGREAASDLFLGVSIQSVHPLPHC